MSVFRHHEEKVWEDLCAHVGGESIAHEGWRDDKIVCSVEGWQVTLDLFSLVGYKSEVFFTRIHTFVPNPHGLLFTLRHQSLLSRLSNWFGHLELTVGDPEFDKTYVIKSNHQELAKQIFNPRVREIATKEPDLHLHLGPPEGLDADKAPEGSDELILMVEGEINDIERLRRLYDLFCAALHEICHLPPPVAEA